VGRLVRIKISSRKSDLARIQAFAVGDALKNSNSQIEIEYQFRESLGDKNLTDPLWKMPEKGVFTEDFLEDLENGRTDLVVHSWKDLPIEKRDLTFIAATLPRADQRDVLLFRKDKLSSVQNSKTLKIFSSSPRRAYNLEVFFKEALPFIVDNVQFESVRGNVPTRIQKLFESDMDGLIVAKAALDRLLEAGGSFLATQNKLKGFLSQSLIMITPLEKNPTAAAQGALAIEIKRDREDLKKLLKPIHCEDTFKSVTEERDCLKFFGGGCHQKVGVSVRNFDYGSIMYTRAFTDHSGAVDTMKYVAVSPIPKTSEEKIFPENAEKASWFDREFFDVDIPSGPLWIAKADGLPLKSKVHSSQLVWVSGWETWKKLAKRGVWVTGCNESLGEGLELGLIPLFGDLKFTKLSHDTSSKDTFPTYKLIPKQSLPDLEGRTHFYWMSGSSFKLALERFPQIKDAYHACGPGNTYETLVAHVAKVFIFPSLKHWKEGVLK
jgi:hydroxymethylbilane synthase